MPRRLRKSLSAACCTRQRDGRARSSPWAVRPGFRMLGASHVCDILRDVSIKHVWIRSGYEVVALFLQFTSQERFQGMSLKSFGMQQHAQLDARGNVYLLFIASAISVRGFWLHRLHLYTGCTPVTQFISGYTVYTDYTGSSLTSVTSVTTVTSVTSATTATSVTSATSVSAHPAVSHVTSVSA